MRWTSNTTAHPIDVLIALRTMLGKIDASTKHAANVRVPFVETFLHDGIDEWAPMEKHAFALLMAIFIGDLLASVHISFPEFAVLHFLDL